LLMTMDISGDCGGVDEGRMLDSPENR